jgi:hypothetical protein
MAFKIDSNITGLRYAEESTTIKVLPGSPIWYPLEPNGYADFGGQITTIARNPINPTRQRKKGVTTDLDASGGFGQDLTQSNLTRLLQGFLFANIREKATNIPMNGTAIPVTGVTAADDKYALDNSPTIFAASDLIFASGFAQAANNGLKVAASADADDVTVGNGLVDETPATTAKLQKVGVLIASATADIVVSGSYPRLTRASGSVDWTTFGLIPGEWVFIGGDTVGTRFVNTVNNGFARVRAIAASYIEFDKTAATMTAETGTGLTVHLYFGNVIRNEPATADIVRRTYQLERTLGQDGVGTMSEYLVGAVPSELSIQIQQADKVMMDLSFVATDNEQRDGTDGVKSGDRPSLVESAAFNTSSDFSRIKMHIITAGNTNPSALFAFLTELTITINNNVSPNKAVGVLGAFDVSVGTFQVGGSLEAYFADVTAVQAVRDNADVAIDFALVKNNAGMVWDLALVALGEGRLTIEQDQPIKLPLSMEAAEGSNSHTLLFNEFPYLPSLADA